MSGANPQPPPSATMLISADAASVFPVGTGYYPQEGSRAVTAMYNWTAQTAYTEDLSQLVAKGVETAIQTVFIDNSECAQSVTLAIGGSGQKLECPPNAQAVFPIFFTGTPNFQIYTSGLITAVTRCTFLNFPMASALWSAIGSMGAASARVIVPLDVNTVAVGGTAVTALNAGHRTAGGWIANPSTATANLGINEIGVATGTTSLGNTTFIIPGQSYNLTPSPNAVSVISSDGAHAFSGYGLQ